MYVRMETREKVYELVKKFGFEAVLNAVQEITAERVRKQRKCLITGKTLCHEVLCAYCQKNCPLAGGNIKQSKKEVQQCLQHKE